ncbi:hypothetical protein N0V94_001958 [Neodidymelliopsis sp. IMI 364377]|nr:hypothetical protein N0V94_001958 [Neodidymelliopsis sp. IMI 364377]
MCLLDRSLQDYKSRTKPRLSIVESGTYSSIGWIAPPKQFRNVRRRHFRAASVRRWLAFLATFVVAIGVSIFLLIYGVYFWKNDDKSDVYSQGIGTVDPRAFITWSIPTTGVAGLLCNVLIANAPQLILSFLYLNYNGLMTVMSLAHEWARYGIRRNGLRVSKTTSGAQRSTYFLQLPYRFGVPIIVVTGTLHWLVSQSIFLVSVEGIKFLAHANDEDTVIWDTENPSYLMTCGYSPPAILASIIVLSLLFVWIISIGFVKLPSSMPVAASCSAAIAAACHLPAEQLEENAAEAELMWGEMEDDEQEVGHCGFSMYEVRQPVDGKLYA